MKHRTCLDVPSPPDLFHCLFLCQVYIDAQHATQRLLDQACLWIVWHHALQKQITKRRSWLWNSALSDAHVSLRILCLLVMHCACEFVSRIKGRHRDERRGGSWSWMADLFLPRSIRILRHGKFIMLGFGQLTNCESGFCGTTAMMNCAKRQPLKVEPVINAAMTAIHFVWHQHFGKHESYGSENKSLVNPVSQ